MPFNSTNFAPAKTGKTTPQQSKNYDKKFSYR